MVGYRFQTDDSFVLIDIGWKCDTYISYQMKNDAIEGEGDIRLELAHPCRIWSLIDGPLEDVGFSDAFEKSIKVLAVGD